MAATVPEADQSVERAPGATSAATPLAELIDALPLELRRRALAHSSWVERKPDSYGRLAFLGDSVLGLAVAGHLFDVHPRADIGRLTKVHGQAVSGRACAEVAFALELPRRVRERAPEGIDGAIEPEVLLTSERALASICEAVIGACYLHHGSRLTQAATLAAFAPQIELAGERLLDFKSALQERVARDGAKVRYEVVSEGGPPHARVFGIAATIDGDVVGRGEGTTKKAAEQEAASEALSSLDA